MRLHRSLPLLASLLLAPRALAQTPAAASESYAIVAELALAGSGGATGTLYVAERAAVGMAAHALPSQSPSYELVGGMAWIPSALSAGEPVLLGVVPGGGDSDGGAAARVLGFNLSDPAGLPTVMFAGQPATSVVESSNTALDVLTPPGENLHGNPLGSINVRVLSSLGSDNADDAYVYRPALVQQSAGCSGCTLTIELQAAPGVYHMLSRGSYLPGFALPLPPIEGALELTSGLVPMTGLLHASGDTATYTIPIPPLAVPPFQVDLQSIALDSLAPLSGSFTNRLTVTIGP